MPTYIFGRPGFSVAPRLLLVFLIGITQACFAPTIFAQSQQWDIRWVPADSFFVASVNVSNLLNYEAEDSDLRKYLVERLKKQAGFDLSQMTQVQMILCRSLDEAESFNSGGEDLLVFKWLFAEPQDFADIRNSLGGKGEYEEQTVKGTPIFVPENEDQPSLAFPDDHSMLMAKTEPLLHALENETSMAGLIDRIKESNANDTDLLLTFEQNETTTAILELIAANAEGLPIDIADLGSQAVKGDVTIRFANDKPLRALFTAKSDEGAQRLKGAMDAMFALGKIALPGLKESMQADAGEDFGDQRWAEFRNEQKRLGLDMIAIAERALNGAGTSTEGNQLTIEVVVKGGVEKIVSLLGQQMRSGFEFSEDVRVTAEAEMEEAMRAVENAAEKVEEVQERK